LVRQAMAVSTALSAAAYDENPFGERNDPLQSGGT